MSKKKEEQITQKSGEAPLVKPNDDFADVVSSIADATGIISGIEEAGQTEANNTPSKDQGSKKQKKLDISELDDHVKEVLDDALDENTEDLGIGDDSSASSGTVNPSQVASAVFGIVVLCFAVFGIVSAINNYRAYSSAKKANLEKIAYFESLVLPLSASDAPTFETTESLNNDVIITAACWDIILSPSSSYTSENGMYTISYLDVDTRINKLFGKGVSYNHGSVGDEELSFDYNSETGMYSIPATPRAIAYFPTVDLLEEIEGGYIVTVSYRAPVTKWISLKQAPEKIMTFKLSGNGLSYIITGLEIKEIVGGGDL